MTPAEEFNHKFDGLLDRLPAGWEDLAIEHHAFTRARQIKSPKELLRAVFAYAVADYSLREVAAVLTRQHKWMSDQAVYERLAKCVVWLETLLAQLLCEKATQVSSHRPFVEARGCDYFNLSGSAWDRLSLASVL